MKNKQKVLVLIPKRKLPKLNWPLEEKLQELADLWSLLVEEITPENTQTGDFENWVESAYRILAAVKAVGKENVWVQTQPGIAAWALNGQQIELTQLQKENFMNVGMTVKRHGEEKTKTAQLASTYMKLNTFFKYAGRKCALAGIFTKDETDAENVFLEFRKANIGKIILKGVESKSFFTTIEKNETFKEGLEKEDVWQLIYQEGQKEGLLVQEWVPMRYEYRVFVINHKPLTGAGAIARHTPLDNEDLNDDTKAFSDVLQEYRNDAEINNSTLQKLPKVQKQLIDFANKIAAELAVEVPEMTNYVLDIALGKDDKPLIIELNSLSNAGYFASNPLLIIKEVIKNN